VDSACECGNEPSVSKRSWETIECLHNWRLSCSAQLQTLSSLLVVSSEVAVRNGVLSSRICNDRISSLYSNMYM
jgi:hypothetical protein